MRCTQIQPFKGNKAERIRSMIQTKKIESMKADAEATFNGQVYNRLLREREMARAKRDVAEDAVRNFLNAKGLVEYSKTLKPNVNKCYVSEVILKELNRANELIGLGQKKEADVIFNKIIKRYKLGE